MDIIKFVKYRINRIIGIKNPEKYLRSIGVKIGEGVCFTGLPKCGSEPWLITIGNKCLIADKVQFITHDGSVWVYKNVNPKYKDLIKFGKIVVDDGAFIGVGSTIMPNVRIGKNAVVAACSCVTKDVPDGAVVAGVPARVIATVEETAEKWYKKYPKGLVEHDLYSYSIQVADYYWNLKDKNDLNTPKV